MLGNGTGRGGIGALGRRDDDLQRVVKIRRRDVDGGHVQDQLVRGLVDLRVLAPEGKQGGLRAQGPQVGTAVAHGAVG